MSDRVQTRYLDDDIKAFWEQLCLKLSLDFDIVFANRALYSNHKDIKDDFQQKVKELIERQSFFDTEQEAANALTGEDRS